MACSGLVYSRQGYGQSERGPSTSTSTSTSSSSSSSEMTDPSDSPAGRGHAAFLPDYMHREALDTLPALLHALGITRPLLIGHSDGATIALIHASRFSVAGCVLMAPHVMVEGISLQAIAAAKAAYESGALRQRLVPYHADVDGAFWAWNKVWLSAAFRSFDIRPELPRIQAPLLAIQGEQDPYGSMAQIDDIAARVPHAQLLKLTDCGHSPQRDQAEAVTQAIARFGATLRA